MYIVVIQKPHIKFSSGTPNKPIQAATFNGDNEGDLFGTVVSGAGDVNGDGYADLIVGAHANDNNGFRSGSARVFSGLNGDILYTFNGPAAGDELGRSVSSAGDVNTDGYADLIVGALGEQFSGFGIGMVWVFSGLDGSVLHYFEGDIEGDYLGYTGSGAGDVDGDGYVDLIVGSTLDSTNGSLAGSARVISGASGNILYTFYGDDESDYFGSTVDGLGDIDGDGHSDLVVAAPGDDHYLGGSGSVRVIRTSDLAKAKKGTRKRGRIYFLLQK